MYIYIPSSSVPLTLWQGLDGEATEPIVESLGEEQGEELDPIYIYVYICMYIYIYTLQ